MVISTSCGLWRYMIGDTVKFTRKNPYKFVITGRTKHFINAFGEELIVDNAEKGLAKACAETGAQVSEYSAAPVFMDENAKCRHQWLIEFAKMPGFHRKICGGTGYYTERSKLRLRSKTMERYRSPTIGSDCRTQRTFP